MQSSIELETLPSAVVLDPPNPPTTPPLPIVHPSTLSEAKTAPKSAVQAEQTLVSSSGAVTAAIGHSLNDKTGKKTTRQWDAWTREEEEIFFIALRHVGKDFDTITSRVQSKNKDQVRHYYYRLIRRINKLLRPEFTLDAKNSKDVNSAMLRWWSLLEKQSCSASKLHLKPRRFKKFVTALEQQIMKDRIKASKTKPARTVSVNGRPVVVAPVARKPCVCGSETNITGSLELSYALKSMDSENSVKQKIRAPNQKKKAPPRKRKKVADGIVSTAAMKRWEKAASAGVSLVAEAAEQLERAAAEQLGQTGANCQLSRLCDNDSAACLKDAIEGRVTEGVTEERKTSKLKLLLYPIDETTRKCIEQDGLNPHLELTLKPQKAISSVIRHLSQKWGGTSAAEGQLHLFPYTTLIKSINCGQCWSIDDTAANAGDVYAALGNPSLFRLRYAWLPCQISQPQHVACSELPISSIREEMQPEENLKNQTLIDSSIEILKNSKVSSLENASEMVTKEKLHVSAEASSQKDSTGLLNTENSEANVSEPIAEGNNRPNEIPKKPKRLKSTLQHVDGVSQIDATNLMKTFGQELPDGVCHNIGNEHENSVQKVQDIAKHLGSSWFYDGSNDSFAHRIWAIEDTGNEGTPPSNELDWADSLTNLSVSEFLNEVSQAGHLTLQAGTVQAAELLESLDSFDAAVAAQSSHPILVRHPVTPAWDGEETRDAFTFRKVVSQKQASLCSPEPPQSFSETLKESDGAMLHFADCGSLDAWRQSFNHAEISLLEDLKSDSTSRILRQQLGKGSCSQDFMLVDSLSFLSSGPQILGTSKEEYILSRYKSVGATMESSLDVLQTCATGDNCTPASCSLQTS